MCRFGKRAPKSSRPQPSTSDPHDGQTFLDGPATCDTTMEVSGRGILASAGGNSILAEGVPGFGFLGDAFVVEEERQYWDKLGSLHVLLLPRVV